MAAGTRLFRKADTEEQAPKDVHILIPQACDCANLPGKRNFVDVIKLRFFKWEDYPELSWWTRCNYKSLYKKEAGGSVREGAMSTSEIEHLHGDREINFNWLASFL